MVVTANGADVLPVFVLVCGLLGVACAVAGDRVASDRQAGPFVSACGCVVWLLSMPLVVLCVSGVVELIVRGF
jgi:predicted Abi (CAAX) family protease